MTNPAEVWNCGGGTQSCAIAVLIIQGRLPKPDVALIVDTGREKGSTWDYYEKVLVPNLEAVGVTLHRVSKEKYGTVDLWSKNQETLLIPVFTSETPKGGKFSNFCSDEWKTRVGDRFLRIEHGIRGSRKWIGFSLDETRRWMRMENNPLIRLPLVKDVPMHRAQSIKLVEDMGWPTPPRSACWMCPNQHDSEWIETRDNRPDEFAAAIALEKEVQKDDPNAWLHGSMKPLSEVVFDPSPAKKRARSCESGNCFV